MPCRRKQAILNDLNQVLSDDPLQRQRQLDQQEQDRIERSTGS